MATDYISPWGGLPTGTNPLYGYSSVPQEVIDNFANYMQAGVGLNSVYQDPATGLYWQAQNTLPGGEGEPGNMYGGYRVYQPSADGGFNWAPGSEGTSYDLYKDDGSYVGSEGFNKPSAQRTFNLGLGAVATLGGLSQLGALGGAAEAAGSTAATGAGEVAAGTGAVSSPVVGGGAGAVTATDLGMLGATQAGAGGAATSFLQQAAAKLGLPAVSQMLQSGSTLESIGKLAGIAAPLVGGLLGSQEQEASKSQTQQLPGFLQQPVAGDLIPRTQGLLNSQMPQAAAAGDQMRGVGSGLLGAPVAGNGFTSGAVALNAPTTATNPYATGILDDLQRRQQQLTDQSLNQIAGRNVSAGGMGSTRQAVAQAQAISQGADNFTGAAANFMGGLYNQDQNRALQQYGMDQGFYNQQRGQDLGQVGVGSGLLTQGLQTPWTPIQSTTQAYAPFSGYGTTTQNQTSGGGAMGALGGALGAAQLAKNMGWMGGSGSTGGTPPNPYATSGGWWGN